MEGGHDGVSDQAVMAQNPEVNSRHCAITTWKAASVGEIPNHQSRCKPRTGPKMAPPVDHRRSEHLVEVCRRSVTVMLDATFLALDLVRGAGAGAVDC